MVSQKMVPTFKEASAIAVDKIQQAENYKKNTVQHWPIHCKHHALRLSSEPKKIEQVIQSKSEAHSNGASKAGGKLSNKLGFHVSS